jgi:hypothetical protein
MKKRLVDLRDEAPLLDIVSYGRAGPHPLTAAQRAQIARTIGRVPEVMVQVKAGARTLSGARRLMDYVGREGVLGLETDIGDRADGKGFEKKLTEDWDLDIEAHQRRSSRSIRDDRLPKLVHHVLFSMPAGTPAQKVLQAVQRLALNEWQFKHRYAMALHADTKSPHVHVVLKAMSEQGERLNIRKAALREWRRQFASNLRELGVAANATERAVRGETTIRKRDNIFRTDKRGASTHMQERQYQIGIAVAKGSLNPEPGKASLLETRRTIEDGWRATRDRLAAEGHHELARHVERFIEQMPPVQTENELIAAGMHSRDRVRQIDPVVRVR